jgi:hypothetical protein
MTSDTRRLDGGRFRHEALFYVGDDDLVERVASFVREGAAAGEHALVVLRSSLLERVRSAVGDPGEARVRYADMAQIGRNPARIIPAWREFVDTTRGPLRGVGEPIWWGRSSDELDESERHEALLNGALAEADLWLVCPYDLRSLPPAVLDEAGRNHPIVWEAQGRRASVAYPGPDELSKPFDRSLPEPAGTVAVAAPCGCGVTASPWRVRSETRAGSLIPSPGGSDPTADRGPASGCGSRTSSAISADPLRRGGGSVVRLLVSLRDGS